jgi:hypothetical protein
MCWLSLCAPPMLGAWCGHAHTVPPCSLVRAGGPCPRSVNRPPEVQIRVPTVVFACPLIVFSFTFADGVQRHNIHRTGGPRPVIRYAYIRTLRGPMLPRSVPNGWSRVPGAGCVHHTALGASWLTDVHVGFVA